MEDIKRGPLPTDPSGQAPISPPYPIQNRRPHLQSNFCSYKQTNHVLLSIAFVFGFVLSHIENRERLGLQPHRACHQDLRPRPWQRLSNGPKMRCVKQWEGGKRVSKLAIPKAITFTWHFRLYVEARTVPQFRNAFIVPTRLCIFPRAFIFPHVYQFPNQFSYSNSADPCGVIHG
ncbi:hypothetical protein PGT21_034803 [Puccinia graminis f. sp. tritici]|nr:hypothetical protein PGTUg99_000980 [Puccinia graminis f. sp. tritici]KAA1085017.1 hypothetical protein PGTUg99_000304 [Puccinia graminis f. sp. tritici]KAA1095033.1 hypothetical protein PGT21_034803 [Puccinia graminis f. sp. tritici]